MIHIIGDSHSLTFNGAPDVECHWLGAATAMNIWKKNLIIEEIIKENNQSTNEFWFCFGEIDCRIHIYNRSQETRVPEYVLINNTIDCYLNYLDSKKILIKPCVMAVPPQGLEDNIYGYTYYADRAHRQDITDIFNAVLERSCWEKKLKFVDVWYNTASMTRALWDSHHFKEDKCHMKNEMAIKRLGMYLNDA